MTQPIRKVLISAFGDVSNVNVVDAEIGAPGRDEVQVAPLYAGFSGGDINMRLGKYPMQKKAPLTPGYCLVGRVAACGPGGADHLAAGDLVACLTVYDAEAELVNLPAKHLVRVPAGVPADAATALVLDWSTAYGLVERANVQRGQRVFVHGLSGAVGFAIMKLAQLRGAEVHGTASPAKHDAVRREGATPHAYTDKLWIDRVRDLGGAHAVFDALGFESFDESYAALSDADGGILVAYGTNKDTLSGGEGSLGTPRSPLPSITKLLLRNVKLCPKKRTAFWYITRDDPSFAPNLHALFQLAASGYIDVRVKQVWPMEDVKLAHESWGKGPGIGSYLLRVAPAGDEGDAAAPAKA